MIIGGGTIAYYLARNLRDSHIAVTIIEKDPKRCEMLSEEIPGANVICGADVPCLMNIKGALGRMRADGRLDRDIRVMHIAQILDSRG